MSTSCPVALPFKVDTKIIVSGAHIELYNYSSPYWVGFPRLASKYPRRALVAPLEPLSNEIREDNIRRSRIKIRRLVNSNQDLDRFFTITFEKNQTDFAFCNLELTKYIKRLKRLFPNFKYLAVPEFQKRGAIHYHILCNLPFTPVNKLTKLWGHGFVFLRKVDHVDNLGAYICKYLSKDLLDSRYFSKKKFFYSFNLNRPVILVKKEDILAFTHGHTFGGYQVLFQKEFDTKWLGMITYYQLKAYDLKKVGVSML